jgi:hypothetical protein
MSHAAAAETHSRTHLSLVQNELHCYAWTAGLLQLQDYALVRGGIINREWEQGNSRSNHFWLTLRVSPGGLI